MHVVASWLGGAGLGLAGLLTVMGTSASAQGASYARMSIVTAQAYESNLFAAPASRGTQGDVVFRFGPVLEAGYRSVPVTLSARYAVEAERYGRHTSLNRDVAQQHGGLAWRYRPAPRVDLNVDAAYAQSYTPAEFNFESGLAVGRARARRIALTSAASVRWDPRTTVTVDYAFTDDALAGGVASARHRAGVLVERRTGTRNAWRTGASFERVGFSASAPVASVVVTGGWVHQLTARTGFAIDAGPRLTGGAVRPEASATLTQQFKRGDLAAGFASTQLTAFGEGGAIDVQRVFASGSYRPARGVGLTLAPAVARSARNGRHVAVYLLDLRAAIDLTRRFALVASGSLARQQGTFEDPREIVPNRTVALTLQVLLPPGAPGGGPLPPF